jgi:hypothetical protein
LLGNTLFNIDEIVDKAGFDDHVGTEDNQESLKKKLRPWMKSEEERAAARASKYSAEFVVELNMTRAHETGKNLGIVMNRDADFWPAMVWRVQKTGLIEEWNKANPGKKVLLGDEIVRVNDVQWHANTKTFIQRIAGQFRASRNLMEGTDPTLRLYVQRPRDSEYTRSLARRDRQKLVDVHTHDYAKEFTVELPMPDDIRHTTLDSIMGWTLAETDEWKPVSILNIERQGGVAVWNQEHPDDLVLEGDELLKVDTIITFHRNSSNFMSRLDQHFKNAQKAEATNRSLLVRIQRPRPVEEAFNEAHPMEKVEKVESMNTFSIDLQFDAVQEVEGGATTKGSSLTSSGTKRKKEETDESWSNRELKHFLGWELDEKGIPQVTALRTDGVVVRWNQRHPDQQILPDDQIIEVNGDTVNGPEFSDKFRSTLKSAGRLGYEGAPVHLVLQRANRVMSYVRQNMENGVHMECIGCTTTSAEPPPFVEGQYDSPVPSVQEGQHDSPAPEAQESGHKPDRYGAADDDVIGASEDDVIGASDDP